MGKRTRLAGSWLGMAALLSASLGIASAQSPDSVGPGEVIGSFTAHLRGSQTDHYASLWNVSYDGDESLFCKPGLSSHSTDQQFTIESEPVEVDAVRLPPGTEGWAGQEYLLVPRGMGADWVFGTPDTELFLAPMLFQLPVEVTIDKAYADPATGEQPAEPQPLTVACAGGDGVPVAPPKMDCGERTFTGSMAVLQPQVNVVVAAADLMADWSMVEDLYTNCPASVGARPGTFVWGEEWPATNTGGSLPTVEQLLDPELGAVVIIGQSTGRYEDTGYVSSQALDWTLTLCPAGATESIC